jgi:hypothetical protein
VTPDELVDALQRYRDRAVEAAPAVAMAMAETYQDHLTRVTLRRTYSVPGQFGTPAPPGSPPSYRSGDLARSVTRWPGAASGFTATAHVAPHTIYAAVQEYGRNIYARNFEYMHWRNIGGLHPARSGGDWWSHAGDYLGWREGDEWWRKHVYVPPRPYLQPALADVVGDGSLLRAAATEFRLATAGVWL